MKFKYNHNGKKDFIYFLSYYPGCFLFYSTLEYNSIFEQFFRFGGIPPRPAGAPEQWAITHLYFP